MKNWVKLGTYPFVHCQMVIGSKLDILPMYIQTIWSNSNQSRSLFKYTKPIDTSSQRHTLAQIYKAKTSQSTYSAQNTMESQRTHSAQNTRPRLYILVRVEFSLPIYSAFWSMWCKDFSLTQQTRLI